MHTVQGSCTRAWLGWFGLAWLVGLALQAWCCTHPVFAGSASAISSARLLPSPPPQPHDLATLCCACCELRHLASQDGLWRPLFEKDFPRATQWYTEQVRLQDLAWVCGIDADRVWAGRAWVPCTSQAASL